MGKCDWKVIERQLNPDTREFELAMTIEGEPVTSVVFRLSGDPNAPGHVEELMRLTAQARDEIWTRLANAYRAKVAPDWRVRLLGYKPGRKGEVYEVAYVISGDLIKRAEVVLPIGGTNGQRGRKLEQMIATAKDALLELIWRESQ